MRKLDNAKVANQHQHSILKQEGAHSADEGKRRADALLGTREHLNWIDATLAKHDAALANLQHASDQLDKEISLAQTDIKFIDKFLESLGLAGDYPEQALEKSTDKPADSNTVKKAAVKTMTDLHNILDLFDRRLTVLLLNRATGVYTDTDCAVSDLVEPVKDLKDRLDKLLKNLNTSNYRGKPDA